MKSTLATNFPTFTFSPNTTCVLPIKLSATLSSLERHLSNLAWSIFLKFMSKQPFEMLHLEADHKSCGFPLQHLPIKTKQKVYLIKKTSKLKRTFHHSTASTVPKSSNCLLGQKKVQQENLRIMFLKMTFSWDIQPDHDVSFIHWRESVKNQQHLGKT